MLSGYILILAVLVLGGVIATAGDRIGTKVGKARLSLFGLRPKRTATIVTIASGILVAASTLGILFATSDQLRRAIFDFEKIQRQLRRTRKDLDQSTQQKVETEKALAQARKDQAAADRLLKSVKESLKTAITERTRAINERTRAEAEIRQLQGEREQAQIERDRAASERDQAEIERIQAETDRIQAQAETAQVEAELNQTAGQLDSVSQQAASLRSDIAQLQSDRDQLIVQKEAALALKDDEIKLRDQVIQEREAKLKGLEAQQEFLNRSVQRLLAVAQGLRAGNLAVQRGQILASATVQRVQSPSDAQRVVDRLLQEANRSASGLVRPGTDTSEQIVQITRQEVEQLMNRMLDGRHYFIRIFSAANYLVGETPIQIFTDMVPNQVIFSPGDVVAATSLDSSILTDGDVQQRIQQLVEAANFRARSLGVLTESVQVGSRIQSLATFIEQLKQINQLVELKVVAAEITYTSGPLKLELVAIQNGQVLFRTNSP